MDDGIITGNDAQRIVQLKQDLDKAFTIKDVGELRHFLGIKVLRSATGTILQ